MNIENKTGIKGQFQINVRNENGDLVREYPLQDNLILDNLINLMVGTPATDSLGNNNSSVFNGIYVGTSNAEPVVTNTKLGNCVGVTSTFQLNSQTGKVIEESSLYEITTVMKGTVLNLNNQNITELGLGYLVTGSIVANGNNSNARYVLYTHALIRDSKGTPTTITVKQGEILEITYTVKVQYDLSWNTGSITLVDEDNSNNNKTFRYAGRLFVPSSVNSNVFENHNFMTSTYNSSINIYNGANDERTNTFEKLFNALKAKYKLSDTHSIISIGSGSGYDPATYGILDKTVDSSGANTENLASSMTTLNAMDNLSNWDMSKNRAAVFPVSLTGKKGNTTHYWFSPYNGNSNVFPNGIRQLRINFLAGGNKAEYAVFFIDENGKGILKNDTQLMKISFTCKVERL